MEKKIKAALTTANTFIENTKVRNPKDIEKLLDYFRYTTGTTLDAMLATGILRNSITYYVSDLEKMGVLQAMFRKRDIHTGRMAKHYSANPKNLKPKFDPQLTLF